MHIYKSTIQTLHARKTIQLWVESHLTDYACSVFGSNTGKQVKFHDPGATNQL